MSTTLFAHAVGTRDALRRRAHVAVFLCAGMAWSGSPASAQSEASPFRLVVDEGTPLRVALDRRVIIKRVGQPIEAVLIEPVFAYDRIVIPAGTRVLGHVARRTKVSKTRRALAMLSGDFTPLHDVLLQFGTVVLPDGCSLPVETDVSPGAEHVTLKIAGGKEKKNVISKTTEKATQQAKEAMGVITGPDKAERMKDAGLRALPYHPEFFSKGTVFNARLVAPLDFGPATPIPRAEPGNGPAPESILSARLVGAVDSRRATRETVVEAVLTRPVFSTRHELILPAGTRLAGHVTYVKSARHFRRNGQLRFLFDTVRLPGAGPTTLLASLYSAETGHGERLAIDEEGGTAITNSPARFIAPTLGTLALVGLSHGRLDTDTDGAGPEMQYGGATSGSVAGFVGASITGIAIASLGRPAAVALGVAGVVRTTYAAVFARGKDVLFPPDTLIQVQLAPGPVGRKPGRSPE